MPVRATGFRPCQKRIRASWPVRDGEAVTLEVPGPDLESLRESSTSVTDFVELLDELPRLFGLYGARRLYGAVAYLKADEGTIRHATRKGLLVIRATGSSASIVNEPDFEPRLFWRAAGT